MATEKNLPKNVHIIGGFLKEFSELLGGELQLSVSVFKDKNSWFRTLEECS